MAWEQRGRQRVYYRARKVAGRVVRTYCGSGQQAHQAYAEDAARRARREAEARSWRAERQRLEGAEAALNAAARAAQALARAYLLLKGLRRHARGHWRRRRGA
jgi:hypothetical protein